MFRMANESGRLVIACDGMSCVDRLDARTKYALNLTKTSAPAPAELLINLVIFLTMRLDSLMVLSGETLQWLQERCYDAGLPLASQIHVIKYCLYAHLCQDLFAYLPHRSHFNEATKDNLRKMIKWQYPTFRQIYSDVAHHDCSSDPFALASDTSKALPEMLGTNIVVFSILLVLFEYIQWEGKTKTEVYQLMLEANFGHHILFDMIPTKIQ